MEGQDLRDAKKLWESVAANESRMHLMVELLRYKVGLADIEEFCLNLGEKCRAESRSVGKVEWKVVKAAMESKLVDARRKEKTLKSEQNIVRRKIYKKTGDDSKKSKKQIRTLKNAARAVKMDLKIKYKKKVEHLRKKYRQDEEDSLNEIPNNMVGLEHLSIFDRNKYDEIETRDVEILVLGDIDLTENVKLVLGMHPKFSVIQKLPKDALDLDKELSFAKTRMQLTKEKEEMTEEDEDAVEMTKDEKERVEELDAQCRQIFDPVEKVFDDRKRRVTDLAECSRVTLPKPMKERDEALIEIRRCMIDQIFDEFRNEICKGDAQPSNMSKEELEGLESLKKMIKEKSIIVCKTDKSGKFCVVSEEEYRKMGAVHTDKDGMIGMKDVEEIEKQLNGHCTFWCKMWRSGEMHGHKDRIIDSKMCRSCKVASMYLLVKDHKKDGSTRPVVTGCSSNTRGMSNAVSDFLESVANSIPDAYEVISSEDMLARVEEGNEKARKIIEEGRDHRLRKMRCTEMGISCLTLVESCEQGHRDAAKLKDGITEMHPQEPSHERLEEMTVEEGMRCTDCGPKIVKKMQTECEGCGGEWVEEDYEISLVGNDVKALFPNIKSATTGKIIRKEVERSPLEIVGFDYKYGLRYIAMNKKYTGNLDQIKHLLPWKKKTSGIQAGMKSKFINSKKNLEETQWLYPRAQPDRKERRMIVARVAEIGTRMIFENFTYQFGGEIFVQKSGGPFGARVTMAAARIVMQAWSRSYQSILLRSGLRLTLLAGYVDDGRQSGTTLRRGMRYSTETKKFEYSRDAKEDDDRRNESSNERMARVCKDAMNDVSTDLEFTTESPDEFKEKKLPTLDFKLWMIKGMILHSYFEKEMRTPFVIMKRSAMGEQQRMSILSNELVRRLSNVARVVVDEEIPEIIEHYIQQLKISGYERGQTRDVICSGVTGWQRKILRREREAKGFYRHARSTLKSRNKKKLVEKTTWFRDRDRDEEEEENEMHLPHRKMMGRGEGKKKDATKKNTRKMGSVPEVKAVMFVPYTAGSKLAKQLREAEEKLGSLTGYRLKMVEKAGDKLENLLTKSNPWQGQDCGRQKCLLCHTKQKTGKNLGQDCHTRNLVYETWCISCLKRDEGEVELKWAGDAKKIKEMKEKIKKHLYVGETARSIYERTFEHQYDVEQLKTSSHMLRHLLEMHGGERRKDVEFGVRVLKFTRSSFERQILESVLIQNRRDHHVLNSRSEFNRCAIPRLVSKLGEKELKEWRDKDKEQQANEEKVEEQIRMLRKDRNKDRASHQRRDPCPKRQRMCGDAEDSQLGEDRREWLIPEPEKRKQELQEEGVKPSKRMKRSDIRYFMQQEEIETGAKLRNATSVEDQAEHQSMADQVADQAEQSSGPDNAEANGDSTSRISQAEQVQGQAEQVLGPEIGLGRTEKASTVNKLAVRERIMKSTVGERCMEQAEPLCSADNSEQVQGQAEQVLGPEISPGKTRKASNVNKLAVRERCMDKLAVRERAEHLCSAENEAVPIDDTDRAVQMPGIKIGVREGCVEQAEPMCSAAAGTEPRSRIDQAVHVQGQAEQVVGSEISPGKTRKASNVNKLAVRERCVDKLAVRERIMDKLAVRERDEPLCRANTISVPTDDTDRAEQMSGLINSSVREGCVKQAEPMCSAAARIEPIGRTDQPERVQGQAEQCEPGDNPGECCVCDEPRLPDKDRAEPLCSNEEKEKYNNQAVMETDQADQIVDQAEHCMQAEVMGAWATKDRAGYRLAPTNTKSIVDQAEQPDRAEHCGGQAEQRCGDPVPDPVRDTHPVTLCPTIPGPVARYVNFQIIHNVQSVTIKTPGYSPKIDQAEQMYVAEPNTRTQGEDQCQADQCQGEEVEPNCSTGGKMKRSRSNGEAGSPDRVRAEQRMPGEGHDASSSILITKTIRQCHTRPWPVVRYVDLPVKTNNVQNLITNFDKGSGQAEQMCQAEPEPVADPPGRAEHEMGLNITLCQAVMNQNLIVAKSQKQAKDEARICEESKSEKSRSLENYRRMENSRGMENEDKFSMKMTNHEDQKTLPGNQENENEEVSKGTKRKENYRRLENIPGGWNQSQEELQDFEGKEKSTLKLNWQELRRSKLYLSELHEGWKDLDGKTTRKIEREGKKMRTDLMKSKNSRFGKAGNSKLTKLEEMIVSSNTRRLLEIEETRLNVEGYFEVQKGWKSGNGWKMNDKKKTKAQEEESEHWKSLARNIRLIDKKEQWLEHGWLEISSLEEQRTFLYGNSEKQKGRMTQASLIDKDRGDDSMIGRKRANQMAGIFQKDGKGTKELMEGTTDLRMNNTDNKDAKTRCIGEMILVENTEDKKTSREEESGKGQCPLIDRKTLRFEMLDNEDNGSIPAIEDAIEDVIDNLEAPRSSTHAANKVKDWNPGASLRGKISEMRLPSLPSLTSRACQLTNSEMHCLERSPGGGRVSKTKLGTVRSQQVSSIKKLFENQSTGVNMELLLPSCKKRTNLNPGRGIGNKFRSNGIRQKESFCVSQPDGGYQTGPRQTCEDEFRPDFDWPSQPDLEESNQSRVLLDDKPRERK